MPGAGAALREVVAFFGLEFDKSGFRQLDASINGLRDRVVGLARVFTTGLIANEFRKMIHETATLGDETAKAAERIGIGTDALQELRHAADLSGVATDTFDRSLMQLNRRAAEAAKGQGEAKDTFHELGIALTDANGKLRPAEELLGDVADRMARTSSEGDRLRIANDLLGREGVNLVSMLKDGRGGLEAMRIEAQALGLVMSEKLIASSQEYDDTLDRLRGVIRGVKNVITEELLPGIIDSTAGMVAFIRENRDLLAGGVVEGARFFAELFRTMAELIWRAGLAVRAFVGGLDPLHRGLLGAVAIATGLFLILGGTAASLVLLVALFDDLLAFFRGENSLVGSITEWMTQLYDDMVANPLNPDDVWFVRIIQQFVKWIDTARTHWDELAGTFGTLFLFQPGASGKDPVSEAFNWFGQRFSDSILNRGAAFATQVPSGQLGGAAATGATASVTVHQEINGAPGQSPQEIGDAAARAAHEQFGTVLRQTQRALVPRSVK